MRYDSHNWSQYVKQRFWNQSSKIFFAKIKTYIRSVFLISLKMAAKKKSKSAKSAKKGTKTTKKR